MAGKGRGKKEDLFCKAGQILRFGAFVCNILFNYQGSTIKIKRIWRLSIFVVEFVLWNCLTSQKIKSLLFCRFFLNLLVKYYMNRVLFSCSIVLHCLSSLLFFINLGLHLLLWFQRSDSTDQIYQETYIGSFMLF